jgi:hypothetical protein
MAIEPHRPLPLPRGQSRGLLGRRESGRIRLAGSRLILETATGAQIASFLAASGNARP